MSDQTQAQNQCPWCRRPPNACWMMPCAMMFAALESGDDIAMMRWSKATGVGLTRYRDTRFGRLYGRCFIPGSPESERGVRSADGQFVRCEEHGCFRRAITVEAQTTAATESHAYCADHARRPERRGSYEHPIEVPPLLRMHRP